MGLFIYLGGFTQLMADDFCSVYRAEESGMIRSMWYWYITWHGGYSVSFADAILGLFGRNGIAFVVPLAILIWLAALAWTIHVFLNDANTRSNFWQALPFALVILYAAFIVSPSIKTSLLWWAGLRGYIPPLIIFPFYVGLYLHISKNTPNGKSLVFWSLISFFIMFFNSGFSETFTPLQIVMLAAWLVWLFIKKEISKRKDLFSFLSTGLIGAALGLAAMIFAPGNANRQLTAPPPPPPFEIAGIALKSYADFIAGILSTPEKITVLISVALAGLLFGSLIAQKRNIKIANALLIFIIGLFFVFCCFPPAAYGQSSSPSEHTLIIPVYVLVFAVLIASFTAGQALAEKINKPVLYFGVLAIMLLSFGFSAGAAIPKYYREIPKAIQYAENWRARDEQIKAAKAAGESGIYLNPIENWVGILEPTDNPNFFVNRCMTKYYRIHIISN
ncbi:MAG: DUF6056 family protein [Anaerolineales bacterium]|nr:DUF6056 family protein [Anaerolineales bacterium]